MKNKPETNGRAKRKKCIFSAALPWGLISLAGPALAVDINPFDWMPAPSGTNAIILYGPWSHNTGATLNGQKLDASLDSAVVMPRLLHFSAIDQHPVAMAALLPVGKLWNGSLGGADLGSSKTSVGDLTLTSGYWLYSAPKERKNLVLTGYLTIPTGSYERDKTLNLSSGHYSASLQLGGMLPLADKFTLETTVDASITRSRSNANALGQKQSFGNIYTLQNWVSYHLNPSAMLSVGHAAYWGGKKKLDGMETGFNSRKQQARIALTYWISPTVSVFGQINRDFDVQGGFKGTSGMLRVAKLF